MEKKYTIQELMDYLEIYNKKPNVHAVCCNERDERMCCHEEILHFIGSLMEDY